MNERRVKGGGRWAALNGRQVLQGRDCSCPHETDYLRECLSIPRADMQVSDKKKI